MLRLCEAERRPPDGVLCHLRTGFPDGPRTGTGLAGFASPLPHAILACLVYEAPVPRAERPDVRRGPAGTLPLGRPRATCSNRSPDMFLHDLSPEQRRAFLVLARQVIDADRRLAIQEVERLDRLYVEAGVPAETADAPGTVGDLNLLFPSERARTVVVLDLLLVAYADGKLDPRETAAIREVAARLGIDAATWEDATDWARRYQALLDEADHLGRGASVFEDD